MYPIHDPLNKLPASRMEDGNKDGDTGKHAYPRQLAGIYEYNWAGNFSSH